jgi:hypothetical protein
MTLIFLEETQGRTSDWSHIGQQIDRHLSGMVGR